MTPASAARIGSLKSTLVVPDATGASSSAAGSRSSRACTPQQPENDSNLSRSMFWVGCVQQFFSPAEQAMVPRLVPEGELLTANAMSGQVANVSRLAGSALGGVLAAAGGIVVVTLADVASFLGSAGLLALVRTTGRTAARESGPVRDRLAQVGADLRDGLRLATRHRTLRLLMIFALVTSVGEGIMSTLFTPFTEHVLHGSP